MIHIPLNIRQRMVSVLGDLDNISPKATSVFEHSRIEFLVNLSSKLLEFPGVRNFPEIVTFAFWCRRANLTKIIERSNNHPNKIGVGLAFHISPSNVPINFAFSLTFGLLSGNSNVIRLPSKESESAEIIIKVISDLLVSSAYQLLSPFVNLIKYDREDEVNQFWLSVADARIVWGGDATVLHMRSFKSKVRSREIAFSDRYSLSIMNPHAILESSEVQLSNLCNNLFNDIYLMDQNACSSTQLLAWIGPKECVNLAKNKLWTKFNEFVDRKYEVEPINQMDKLVGLFANVIENNNIETVDLSNSLLFRVGLNSLIKDQPSQRGYFGTVHEVQMSDLSDLACIVDERFQTITYFGFLKEDLLKLIYDHHLSGIDRIVPVGRAIDMDIFWDGYDILNHLTRVIDIH